MSAAKPVTLITGASEGIGRAIAIELARQGQHLLLLARNEKALKALAIELQSDHAITIHICPLDLARKDRIDILNKCLDGNHIYVEALVNNAAIGLCDAFTDHTRQDLLQLVDLNTTALTELCHEYLPAMVKRGRGGILNIASLAGLIPGPYQAAYYASKAYVISLTESLAQENRGNNVSISVSVPGPVNTKFHEKMGAGRALYLRAFGTMDPEQVALSSLRGWSQNRTIITPGLLNTFAFLTLPLMPHTLISPIFAWLLKPRP